MDVRGWWSTLTHNASNLQILFGIVISISTAVTGWKTIELNNRTTENNAQLTKIEHQLSQEKFGFERIKDIYDRTEKYLELQQQDERRGRALVVLINSLPESEIKASLLGIITVEAQKIAVAAKAADAVARPTPVEIKSNSFVGRLVLDTLQDGYSAKLVEPFGFKDSKGTVWTVPRGATVAGDSIPRPLWSVVGSPLSGQQRAAAVLHEYFSRNPAGHTPKDINNMFYEALLKSGVSPTTAKLLYSAVDSFGSRWSTPSETPTK